MDYSPSIGIFLGGIGMAYKDRGDPAPPPDFLTSDFIVDNDWHELDLSSIVPPAGANHLVHIAALANGVTPVTDTLSFRKAGNVNTLNRGTIYIQVANQEYPSDIWVMLDANRKIEYIATLGITQAVITVRGWVVD